MSKVVVGCVTGTFPGNISPGTGMAASEVIVIAGMWDTFAQLDLVSAPITPTRIALWLTTAFSCLSRAFLPERAVAHY